jgi:hypothetical protein
MGPEPLRPVPDIRIPVMRSVAGRNASSGLRDRSPKGPFPRYSHSALHTLHAGSACRPSQSPEGPFRTAIPYVVNSPRSATRHMDRKPSASPEFRSRTELPESSRNPIRNTGHYPRIGHSRLSAFTHIADDWHPSQTRMPLIPPRRAGGSESSGPALSGIVPCAIRGLSRPDSLCNPPVSLPSDPRRTSTCAGGYGSCGPTRGVRQPLPYP